MLASSWRTELNRSWPTFLTWRWSESHSKRPTVALICQASRKDEIVSEPIAGRFRPSTGLDREIPRRSLKAG